MKGFKGVPLKGSLKGSIFEKGIGGLASYHGVGGIQWYTTIVSPQ